MSSSASSSDVLLLLLMRARRRRLLTMMALTLLYGEVETLRTTPSEQARDVIIEEMGPWIRGTRWFAHAAQRFNAVQFQQDFRLHQLTFRRLMQDIVPFWPAHHKGRPNLCSPTEAVLMLLSYMADNAPFRASARTAGLSKATCWRAVRLALACVCRLLSHKVKFPTGSAIAATARKWQSICGLKGVLFAVDATHIPFKARIEDKKYAANRKG